MKAWLLAVSLGLAVGAAPVRAGDAQADAAWAGQASAVSGQVAATASAAGIDPDLRHWQSVDLGFAQMPGATEYLNRLLAGIQAVGPQPPRPARVAIWPRMAYNAASTPSGLIVVDLGWLLDIDSEAELIGLLAHEYGHIALQHMGAKNDVGTAVQVAKIGVRAAGLRTGGNAWTSAAVDGSWSGVLMPHWSRSQEFEADEFSFNATRGLGLAYVSSVRAFIERIRAFERTRASNARDNSLSDDHPDTQERIDRLQALALQVPRVRPSPAGPDGWRQVRDGADFRAAAAEYKLSSALVAASKARHPDDVARLALALDQLPKPLRTSGALIGLAMGLSSATPESRVALLQAAMAAPDASLAPYMAVASVQRDVLRQYPEAYATLNAGMDRFGQPPQKYADYLEFVRVEAEQINALPPQQKGLGLNLFLIKAQMAAIAVKAKCLTEPDYANACSWADLSDAQKAQRQQAQQDQQNRMMDSVKARVQKVLH